MVQVIPVVLISLFLLAFVCTSVSLYLRVRREAEAVRLARLHQASMQNYAFHRYNNPERAPPVVRAEQGTDTALPSYLPQADRTQELPRLYEMIRRLEAEPDIVENRGLLQDLRNEVGRLKGPRSTGVWSEANQPSVDQPLSYNEVTAMPAMPPPMYSAGQRAYQPHP
ncbi:hypothetical protein BJ165DRAFT_1401057 [Panaeolus papilionaceus]|nr:hypothetical protein BJ165DRAFT_1401057 [Panaeolus papilionaceus]